MDLVNVFRAKDEYKQQLYTDNPPRYLFPSTEE